MSKKFDVVISGMSGRFPGIDDVDSFKKKLYNGAEFTTVDNGRWPIGFKHKIIEEKLIPDATGKIRNRHTTDYMIFKMSTAFFSNCDYISRMVLEPSFEAIVDAGINPYSLDGQNIAVFMSTGHNDNDQNMYSDHMTTLNNQTYIMAGSGKAMLANRISYAFNLTGPSYTTFSDAHGGISSLAMAYKHVSEGFAEAALVGVASSIDDPRTSLQFLPFGMLSTDGRTRPFDRSANGYARSEGVVCFYLQRVEDAKRIYGEINFCDYIYLGSAVRPNIISYDEEFLKTTLRRLIGDAKLDLSDIDFVEMNAYGDKETDRIESNAIAELFSVGRNEPLMVGSIKSNIGHTEAAAGLMGVLKALLAFESGVLAPNQNVQKLNDDIQAFKENRLQIVSKETPFLGNTIAVNSISLFGTMGFALLKQDRKFTKPGSCSENFPRLLLICGRDQDDLNRKVERIQKLPHDINFIALTNDVFLQSSMPSHMYRAYTVLPSLKSRHEVCKIGELNRPVWFIFSGMGSQWNGMGKSLLRLPLFAETVAKCDKVLSEKNIDIYHILTSDDKTLFDNILNAFVGIITVQIGLFEVIKAVGIKPDGIIGHSVGENACAYADGCLSLEQAVLASWSRGVASTEVETIKGMMAAVGKGNAEIQNILPEDIEVACHNSDDSCTLSGPTASVNAFVTQLKKKGYFTKAVNVSNIAYHSRYIAPAGPHLSNRLKQLIEKPKLRSSKWISTSVPENEWNKPAAQYCSAEYLTNNLLGPVLFQEGCKHIPSNAICIEVAPHGLLQAILNRAFPETCTNIPLTDRRNSDTNLHYLLAAIGKLYTSGLQPKVNNIFPSIDSPVPRGTPSLSPYCSWYHENDPVPRFLTFDEEEARTSEDAILICIKDNSQYAFLQDHAINGKVTIPPSFFMYLVWSIFSFKEVKQVGYSPIIFEEIRMHNQVTIKIHDTKYAFIMINKGSGKFEVLLRDEEKCKDFIVIMTGVIRRGPINTKQQSQLQDERTSFMKKTQFYDAFKRAGYNLGNEFQLIDKLYQEDSGTEYKSEIIWNGNWVTFLDSLMKLSMFATNKESAMRTVLTGIGKLEIAAPKFSLLEKGATIPCSISIVKGEVFCNGVTMYNLKCDDLHSKPDVQLIKYHFVSYKNPKCQNAYEFLTLCLQIFIEHMFISGVDVKRLLIFDTTNKYIETIEKIIHEQDFSEFVAVLLESTESRSATLLLTSNADHLIHSTHQLILLISPHSWLKNEELGQYFVEITKQSFSGTLYSLLKKKSSFDHTQEVSLHFVDTLKEKQGPKQVKSKCIREQAPYYIIRNNIEFDDVSRMVEIQMKRDHANSRYLYIMEEERINQSLLLTPKNIDLPVSVLQYGEWGMYRNLIQNQSGTCRDVYNSETKLWSLIKQWDGQMNLEYIYYSRNDYVSSNCTFPFSYVASVNPMEKQIGFASLSSEGLLYDPHLVWTIPRDWNLEEAVTVPYTYIQAYFLLFQKNILHQRKSVMINVGEEFLLAEAFIALSLDKGLKVFVTVCTDEEVSFIRNRFPEIPTERILRTKNFSYLLQIRLQMKRQGVDLVVNCLSGIKHVEKSLECVARDGICIDVGMNNCQQSSIGLYTFVDGKSFLVKQYKASDFLELPIEKKKKLKKLIEECIERHVIVPPRYKVMSRVSPDMKISKCHSGDGNHTIEQLTVKYNKKHSYIIIVGTSGMKKDLGFALIEWLILQGARKFVIVIPKFISMNRYAQLLHHLSSKEGVKIIFTSVTKLDTREDISVLLNDTEKLAPLEAVYFLSVKNAGQHVSNLDELVSPGVFFIGLSSGGLNELERRRSKGSPSILIHSADEAETLIALPTISNLFIQEDDNNAGMLYKIVANNSSYGSRNKIANSICLQDYLPQSVEILTIIGQDESNELQFVESNSLSKRYVYCKSVHPIFALSAIHTIMLRPLLQRLFYPVFSVTVVSAGSTDNVVQKLYHSLTTVQPRGPVTVISEMWNLAVAVKLQLLLATVGRECKIISLEGNPKNWVSNTNKADVDYAEQIFHFDTGVKNQNVLSDTTTFACKIEKYANNVSNDARVVKHLMKGAHAVCNRIIESRKRQFTTGEFNTLHNTIILERYPPDDKDFKLSISSKIVVIREAEYTSFLNNSEVIRIINENAEFSWRESPQRNKCR